MSKVISFKVPDTMAEEIDDAVEKGNYQSRGEFLRALVRSFGSEEPRGRRNLL